jgi:glutamate synthase (ferredoxin)
MASEVGVLDIAPENIREKGRLQPGRMFYIDTELGRIVADEEIKEEIAQEQPYRHWLNQHLIDLSQLPEISKEQDGERASVVQRQQAFGAAGLVQVVHLLLVVVVDKGLDGRDGGVHRTRSGQRR